MGKDKSMNTSKSERKKKKKDRENDLTADLSQKNIISNMEDEDSDDNDFNLPDNVKKLKTHPDGIRSLIPQKHNDENPSPFGSSKKKSKYKDEILVYESPKKKIKKKEAEEIVEDNFKHVKKSKKDRESSPKKKTNQEKESKEDKGDEVIPEPDITLNPQIVGDTGWPKEDLFTLLENILKVIPEKDSLTYTSRSKKLDWDSVAFSDYTPEECKEKWNLVEKKIRRFRILGEMVKDAKLWVEKPWSSFYNSNKKNRHPDMPRKPLSSFMLFYMAKKPKYSERHPTLGLVELSKVMGSKYNKLSESKKQKYADLAKSLREEYNEKMETFIKMHPEIQHVNKKIKEEKTQMPGPKRPLSPFKLFCEEKLKLHDENDGISKVEYMAQVKDAWKNLSTKKKVHWIRWAHENEKKYLEEMEISKEENPNFEMPKIKPLLSKEEITILERMDGKPEKPPNSAYSLFSRLMLKDKQIKLINFSPKERMREISRLWSAVSAEEKKQYQEKTKHLIDIYKLEYATYLESLPADKKEMELAKSQMRKRKIKDPDPKKDKLKQTKVSDLFQKKKAMNSGKVLNKPASSDECEDEEDQDEEDQAEEDQADEDQADEDQDEEDQADDQDEYDILKNPKKLKEIKSKIEALDPPKPSLDAFEVFKEVYLSNPANKVSRAKMIWDSMPKKEKERYQKSMERQKQEYILNYKNFLTTLKPDEIKVYYMMKNESSLLAPHLLNPSEAEESDDLSDEEDDKHMTSNVSPMKNDNTSSDSD